MTNTVCFTPRSAPALPRGLHLPEPIEKREYWMRPFACTCRTPAAEGNDEGTEDLGEVLIVTQLHVRLLTRLAAMRIVVTSDPVLTRITTRTPVCFLLLHLLFYEYQVVGCVWSSHWVRNKKK